MSDARLMLILQLAGRRRGATLCPSEVARAMAVNGGDWRQHMPAVHAAVDAMVEIGSVSLSWKGVPMPQRDGPYRIARATGPEGRPGDDED